MALRVRRVLKVSGGVVLLLVVLLVLAWAFREPLFGSLLRRAITEALSEELGGRYEIEATAGSWISDLELRGLRTAEPPPAGALVDLSFDTLKLRYDLLGLLAGRGLDAVSSVEVAGLSAALDIGREDSASTGQLPSLAAEPFDATLPRLKVEGRVDVRAGEARLAAREVRVTTADEEDALEVVVRDVVSGAEYTPVEGSLEGRLVKRGSAQIRWTSRTSLGGLAVPSLVWWLESGRILARLEVRGGLIAVAADPEKLEASTQRLDLARLPSWIRPFVPERPGLPVRGEVSGRLTLRNLAPLRATFDLRGRDLTWPERTIDRLRATGRTRKSDDALLLDALELEGDDAIVQVRGAVLDPALPFLLRDVRQLVIEVEDLGTLVPGLPRPIRLAVQAHGAATETILLDDLRLEDRELGSALATGSMTLPASPEAWRETRVELDVRGELTKLSALHPELAGRAAFQGRILGTWDELKTDVGVQGRDAFVAGLALTAMRGRGLVRWPEVEVEELTLEGQTGTLEARGRLGAERLRVPEATFELKLSADGVGRLARRLVEDEAPAVRGRLRAKGGLRLEGSRLDLQGAVTVEDLRVDETEVGRVEALVGFADETLRAEKLEVVGPWGRAVLAGEHPLDGGTLHVSSLEAEIEDTRITLVGGTDVQEQGGELQVPSARVMVDDLETLLSARANPERRRGGFGVILRDAATRRVLLEASSSVAWDESIGTVRLEDLRLADRDGLAFSGTVTIRPEDASAVVERGDLALGDAGGRLNAPLRLFHGDGVITIQGLDASIEELRARGDGRVWIKERRAEVSALLARYGEDVEARLTAPLAIRWNDGRVRLDDIDAAVEDARVRGSVALGDEVEADLEASGVQLARWIPDLSGSASARLRLRGEEARVDLSVPDLAALDRMGSLQATIRQGPDGGGLALETLRVEGPHGLSAEGRGVFPWRIDPAEGLVRVADAPAELAVDGRFGTPPSVAEIQAGPLAFSVRGRGDELLLRAGLADVVVEAARDRKNDVEVSAALSNTGLRAEARVVDERTLTLRGALRVAGGADWTRPDTWAALLDAPLEASLASEVRDWKPIAELLRVKRLEGAARVELSASGTPRRPALEGAVEVTGLALALEKAFPPFEEVTGRIVWNGKHASIERLEGLLGYETFRISGTVETPPGAYPVFDVRATGENLLLLATSDMRLRTDLDLAITGPLDGLLAKGEVRITDLFYAITLNPGGEGPGIGANGFVLFTLPEWPLRDARFDVRIVADETIRIRNNLLIANVSADLALGGKGARPRPEGRVVSRGARVILPTRTLYVEGAEIRFPPGAPFSPTVRATARARAGGFELGARVSGRLPDLDVNVFSRPRLPPDEAMLLLATGGGGGGAGAIEAITLQTAVAFFGDNLLTFAKSESDPELRPFFDRFTVVAGRQRSRRGRETVEAEVETIDRLFLHAERDRFDESNLGFIWRMRFR